MPSPIKDAEMQLYRPRGKIEIPGNLKRSIRSLNKSDFDSFRELIFKEGYLFHAEDCTRQSISYPDYVLDGSNHIMRSGQVASQGSLYFLPRGRSDGWICPIIKINACSKEKINNLEKKAGINRR